MENRRNGRTIPRVFEVLTHCLRGRSLGQSTVEYVSIVGTCAIVGMAGFQRYGANLGTDLRLNGERLEGRGFPGLVDPREALPDALVGNDDEDDGGDDEDGDDGRGGTGGRPEDSLVCPPRTAPSFRGAGASRRQVCVAQCERETSQCACGQIGTYREFGGGGENPMVMVVDSKGQPYHRDHIPAKETLWLRAQRFIDSAIQTTWKENDLCPGADAACIKEHTRAGMNEGDGAPVHHACKKDKDGRLSGTLAHIFHEVCMDGPVMLVPGSFHRQGRTYGQSIPGDENNIPRAVERDLQEYYELVNASAGQPDFTDNCNAQDIRDAILNYSQWDAGQYDDLVRGAVERVLTERSDDFVEAVENACKECGS